MHKFLQTICFPFLSCVLLLVAVPSFAQQKAAAPPAQNVAPAVSGPLLTYALQPGSVQHYLVTAYFDGHFPPFDQPGDPPVHLLAHMEYVAHVGQPQQDGLPVDFTVTQVDMQLLQKEVPIGAKIDPKQTVPFPIELEQAQKALNTSVVLRPDGSIARILTAPNNMVRVNVGIDLRKLFMIVMPVILPNTAVTLGTSWTSKEGVIGTAPAKVSYTNKLNAMKPDGVNLDLKIMQTATSQIDDTLDSSGMATNDKQHEVSRLQGTASLIGWMNYLGTPAPASNGVKTYAVRMQKGLFKLTVKLKQTPLSNAANATPPSSTTPPYVPTAGNVDVSARFVVQALDQAALR
ncbi:MAG TPA: hypothetical protein VKV18_00105 [Chthonomonas sp.]|uniref:hypothetical protein n=1 Tax=Chthonomonas sp. TaxID=2282153 RepID=UPI002B4AAFA5|nr:hypothetical protein [Chthonomonas sp.]HLI47083.1 hypothetical protein [Chthonomonas sp.]